MTNEQRNELTQIKHDLLVWAGYHRGKGISEEAMPRFHEIIDRLDTIIDGGTEAKRNDEEAE